MKTVLRPEETMCLHKDLSWLWPIISPPESYGEEGDFFVGKIGELGGKIKTILKLGCGGGHC
jgi:hypothetical protein